MKIVKFLFLISPTILALLLLAAYSISKHEQAGEAEREAPIHKAFAIAVKDGATTLTVDDASQARGGIQTKVLAEVQASNGPPVYGTVVDMQPLFEMSSRYAASVAELRAAQAELDLRETELKRAQALYDDKQNVSHKVLDAVRADVEASRAKAGTARIASAAAGNALRQQFGPTLASWAMAPSSPEMAALMARKHVLVRVAPLSQDRLTPQSLTLYGDAQKPAEARLVSASPQTDPGVQGQAWFYRIDVPLAVGTRLAGRASLQQRSGVHIPAEAVVWYGGQPWVYVRTNRTVFERRLIEQGSSADGGFLVTHGFTAGEAVVFRGAQLLMSEESRALLSKD